MDDDFPGAGDVTESPLFVGTGYHIRCFSVNSIVRSAGIFLFLMVCGLGVCYYSSVSATRVATIA